MEQFQLSEKLEALQTGLFHFFGVYCLMFEVCFSPQLNSVFDVDDANIPEDKKNGFTFTATDENVKPLVCLS